MKLTSTHWIILSLVLFSYLIIAVMNLVKFPQIHPPDEAVFSSISYSLLHNEMLGESNFEQRLPSIDKAPFTQYGPTYLFSLAVPLKLFGNTIYTIRGYSVFIGLLCLIVFYLLLKSSNDLRLFNLTGVLLLGTDFFFLNSAKIGRMEILAIFFQLLAYWSYFRTFSNKNIHNYVLVGLFISLSFFTHFIAGLPALLAIGLHSVLLNRGFWKNKNSYFTPAIFISSIIFWCIYIFYFAEKSSVQGASDLLIKRLFPTFVTVRLVINDGQNLTILNIIIYAIGLILASFKKNKTAYDTFWIISALSTLFIAVWGEQWIYLSILSVSYIPLLFLYQHDKNPRNNNWGFILRLIIVTLVACVNLTQQIIIFDRYRDFSYDSYGKGISECIPRGNPKVMLDVIPDPYFYLSANRKDVWIGYKTYPEGDGSSYRKSVENADYIVVSAAYDKFMNHPDLIKVMDDPATLSKFGQYIYYYYLVRLDLLLYIKSHKKDVCVPQSPGTSQAGTAAVYKLR